MSYSIHDSTEKHPKQDFQVERIAFFSDAVFAIAITLLIIEFRPPHIEKGTTANEVWHELLAMKFKLAALLISFILIVNYWMRHHALFKHIHNYNREVIVANMTVLFPMIFFPFTTAFLYESIGTNEPAVIIPFRLFMLNNILAGATTYYFYYIVTKRYGHLSYPMTEKEAKSFEQRLLLMVISFSCVFALSFVSLAVSMLGLLPIAGRRIYDRNISKKAKKNPANDRQKTITAHP